MKRRLRLLPVFAACLAVVGAAPQPNIVVVLADDLGVGDVSCYAAGRVRTPHLDRLAAEGIRFTDAHSASAVCTPSRYALLTGRYPWRTGMREGVSSSFAAPMIDPARTTIASFLRGLGYATAAVGKWHLGLGWQARPWVRFDAAQHDAKGTVDYAQPFVGGPTRLGFDYFFGMAASLDMPPYVFLENDRVVTLPEERQTAENLPGRGPLRAGPRASGWSFGEVDVRHWEAAERWVRARRAAEPQRPFFLYLSLSAPHSPYYAPEMLAGRSGIGHRGDLVLVVDWVAGRLLALLEELQIRRETLVVLTSDNGAPAESWEIEAGHRANGPWRGDKSTLFEGGHRVPLIVSWPGSLPAGEVSEALVSNHDLLATFADLLGQEPCADASDAESFLAALRNPREAAGRRSLVHHSFRGRLALREGEWKLLASLDSGGFAHATWILPEPGGPGGLLFNLARDPGETDNRWLAEPGLARRLARELQRIVFDEAAAPPP